MHLRELVRWYFKHSAINDRDKFNMDLFWLKNSQMEPRQELPPPAVLQQEIISHVEAALHALRRVSVTLKQM